MAVDTPDVSPVVARPDDGLRRAVAKWSDGVAERGAFRVLLLSALVLPIVGLVAVIVADLVPDRWVMDELFEATVSGDLDTESYGQGYAGNLVDGYSECKRITIGLGDLPGTNVVESAIKSPTLGPCESAVPRIVGWAEGDGLQRLYDYTRYWNGSALVFRPGIALLGVAGSRMLAAFTLIAAVGFLAWRTRARLGGLPAVFLLVPIVATTDFIDLPGALLHALAWVLVLVIAGVLLDVPARATNGTVAWWSFLAGAVFLFFADMTNPEAAWALATGALSLGAVQTIATRALLQRTVVGAGAWVAGYAWMWIAKWIIGSTVWGVDVMWDNVVGQIEIRLGGEYQGVDPTAWTGIERVADAWWSVPLTRVVVPLATIAAIVVVVRRRSTTGRGGGPHDPWARVVVAGAGLIPLVWYVTLRNHTYLHAWFVYRSLAVAFGLVLAAVVLERRRETAIDPDGPRPDEVAGAGRAPGPETT